MEFDVRSLFPKVYDGYKEIDEIADTENILFGLAKSEVECIRAVSYTHLDVYKRQVWHINCFLSRT